VRDRLLFAFFFFFLSLLLLFFSRATLFFSANSPMASSQSSSGSEDGEQHCGFTRALVARILSKTISEELGKAVDFADRGAAESNEPLTTPYLQSLGKQVANLVKDQAASRSAKTKAPAKVRKPRDERIEQFPLVSCRCAQEKERGRGVSAGDISSSSTLSASLTLAFMLLLRAALASHA
jgi:hypothetical protein